MFKNVLVLSLVFSLVTPSGIAADGLLMDRGDIKDLLRQSGPGASAVYVFGDQALDNLIPVKVLGAVQRPGLHYVPVETDFLTLISLAGGMSANADYSDITIRRSAKKDTIELLNFDMEKMTKVASLSPPNLVAQDTIIIPPKAPLISDDTLKVLTVTTTLASLITTAVLLAPHLFPKEPK